jgi:hypothetical protein
MSNLYRGLSKDVSNQVPVHLAKRFQRRRFFKIGQNPEILATLATQYTGQINIRENRWDNQEWTI